jgi:hypothetical protein
MTSTNMLEVEGQVSDDFGLYYDGIYYYAVRAESEGKCHFAIKDKSMGIVISEAVSIIHDYLWNLPEPKRPTPRWDHNLQLVKWTYDSNS